MSMNQARSSIDREQAIDALDRSTSATAAMLRAAGSKDVPIPHLTWTVAQCAAHQVISDHLYVNQVEGPGAHLTIERTSELNDWSVERAAGLEPAALASDLEASTRRFIATVRELPADATFTWWSGARAPVDTAVALLVGERLVHGWDVGRATGAPWPIPGQDAAIAMAGSFEMMPLLVDPQAARGFSATYEMRLRDSATYELRFEDGALTTSRVAGVERADCRISAHPTTLMLLGYGRISQWSAIARGRMFATGRKPWLGMRLGRVLRNP
jgi:uncharacterized protein (TIGR03083 family)